MIAYGGISLEGVKNNFIKRTITLREFPAVFATLLLFIILTISSKNFFSVDNIMNMLRQASVIVIVSLGEAFILISGEVDISVGALMGFCGIIAALLWKAGAGLFIVLAGTLAAGVLVLLINGMLITRLRLASFVVSLGMLSILKGSMLVITGGFQLKYESPLSSLGYAYIGPFPCSVLLMLVLFVLAYLLLNHTSFGRNVLYTGANAKAAQLSGIITSNVKLKCFLITGAMCALSGLIMAGSVLSAGAASGLGYENDIIAACIIGGTTLMGGEGSVVGVFFGGILLALMRNGFVLLNIGSSWQIIATGFIIVGSIILDSLKNNRNKI
jgi:ribose transport system permease protein